MFYLINKEKNVSSFQEIKKFGRQNQIKTLGHTGTLDPFATGLLLVATEDDTKLIQYIKNSNKTYEVTIKFGYQSNTFDSDGEIINTSKNKVTADMLSEIKIWFETQTQQQPPIFSAKKINGQRAYHLARNNQTEAQIALKPIKITVSNVKILDFDEQAQELTVSLEVSNGTYIRSLANDLGLFLQTFALAKELKRTKIADFTLAQMQNEKFLAVPTPQLQYPLYFLEEFEITQLKNGLTIEAKHLENTQQIYFFIADKTKPDVILGVVQQCANQLKVKRLFGNRLTKY
ncbi:tRNA pseudouridine(55) synthase TruB [Mycoplasmopsis columbinasalis]|uniref:tRNA pseudouridine synthase B n=1 Tax=Mycoplasmopsis columbinasalis TaxID=114880 RepID=A0A449B9X1_9BACT|nr:tRNA pseudouridine(55) synthase TruB [Mycoplasmopsis columbinasalis]VEU77983.1 tRNA pseudouridine synthase B [Mycoplasmopsis columbinasalis]